MPGKCPAVAFVRFSWDEDLVSFVAHGVVIGEGDVEDVEAPQSSGRSESHASEP